LISIASIRDAMNLPSYAVKALGTAGCATPELGINGVVFPILFDLSSSYRSPGREFSSASAL
jgi:hypothetical protein